MSKRFLINEDAFLVVNGRKKFFQAKKRQADGSPGFTLDEMRGLSRDQRKRFREVTVDGFEGVEQATAAPGEKRSVRSRETTDDIPEGEAEADSE